jgi:Phage tail tube protein
MALAEGTQGRVVYKAYAVGTMDSNSQPVSTVDPGNTGGQVLRRTSVSMNLEKDTYQAAEIVLHRQITDFRHGVKRVNGSINGELSCGTYWDFLEAVCRGTETASVALSNTELTTVTSDSTTSKFTFGADPVAAGLRVGHVIRFTNLTTTANNTTNFIITGFSGVNNVDVTVYPAPTTGASDATFNVVQTGKTVSVPDTGHVSRKFAVETYYIDADIYRLFTECRVGGFNMTLPATGLATVEMPFMGRGMETGSAGSAPFFASPTAPTTTGINAAVNGLIRVQGENLGVVTGATINFALAPVADPVVGQNFVPEIFLGRANASGQITAMLEDFTLVDYFVNETEVEILLYLTSGTSATADAFTIYMPRVKFGGASVAMDGEAAQIITMPFQALKLGTASLGKPATTIQFSDTAAV